MANQERDPRAYELMTVFVPDISEEDTQAEVEKVSTYIANAGGTVSETLIDSPWGRRRLAYTIRYNGTDYRDGYYTVFHFDSAPSNLTELERDLKLDTSVMRYLLVHNDPKAGEKPREGEDEATEGEAPTEAPAAPQQAAPAQQTEPEADAATASEPVEAQEQATETVAAESETAPAEAESAPEAAAVADTTEDAETPAVEADSASNEEAPAAEADSASDEEPAAEPAAVATESDTDETTDKE